MTDKSWEQLLREAYDAMVRAQVAMHDIADWSGSSGNWPLHDSLTRVDEAMEILKPIFANDQNKGVSYVVQVSDDH